MKNTVFPHKFWRPYLDCMPQLFFRPQYVWFPVHLKGHLIPLCYETLVVNWQNWLFTLFHQSRSVLSPNPISPLGTNFIELWIKIHCHIKISIQKMLLKESRANCWSFCLDPKELNKKVFVILSSYFCQFFKHCKPVSHHGPIWWMSKQLKWHLSKWNDQVTPTEKQIFSKIRSRPDEEFARLPPPGQMAPISQTIFSDTFSQMKSLVFWLKFHLSLFHMVQLTIIHHWSR